EFAKGEYMLDWTFYDGDAIKVAKVASGAITTWYKDGMDNEYKITAEGGKTGEGTLYFRPEGNAEWSYFYLTVQPKVVPTETPSTVAPTTAEPTQPAFDFSNYCLCGYINGKDYGMTEQTSPKWNEPGDYVFAKDGTLTVTFTQDTYVQVKTLHGESWYAFKSYVSDGTTTALGTASDTCKEKMKVPANTKVTFTLSKNASGAFQLGYVSAK
ncbi:MAG: hypothetical protein KBS62_07530, partial [Oscillospiraceae bacterium]|nr:hypothetical protein [Candidatus Ruminococcus equi]